jgi:hypothetical protein
MKLLQYFIKAACFFLLICFSVAPVMGQKLKMVKENDTANVFGKTLTYTTRESIEQYFYFDNPYDSSTFWKMQCIKSVSKVTTYEDLCFGEKDYSGNCQHFSNGDTNYVTYNTEVRGKGQGEVKVAVKLLRTYGQPYLDSGVGKFHYILRTAWGQAVDSFDVIVNFLPDPIIPTGISDAAHPGVFTVYPNPAMDVVNIKIKDHMTGTLRIMDYTGKVVLESPVSDCVQVAHLDNGIYIVELKNEERSYTQKLLIDH